jgi:hypothetical protein
MPHAPAASPSPHGPTSCAASDPSPNVLMAALRPSGGAASPATVGRTTKDTPNSAPKPAARRRNAGRPEATLVAASITAFPDWFERYLFAAVTPASA